MAAPRRVGCTGAVAYRVDRRATPFFYATTVICTWNVFVSNNIQLSATDVSAQVTMKDAAKCDKRSEWQNSANLENAERILHFWVPPKVCLAEGVKFFIPPLRRVILFACVGMVFLCASDAVPFWDSIPVAHQTQRSTAGRSHVEIAQRNLFFLATTPAVVYSLRVFLGRSRSLYTHQLR